MSKVVAYYVLHYGVEWLYHSLRSIAGDVDHVIMLHTHQPSFGHDAKWRNPEHEEQLRYIARLAARDFKLSLDWVEAPRRYDHEGQHRDHAVQMCWDAGADIILVVDADELWPAATLKGALRVVENVPQSYYRINMKHLWRSAHWICDDPAMPLRLIRRVGDGQENYLPRYVYHCGYAQTEALVRYKMSIHGHLGEIRPGWIDNTFARWHVSNPFDDVHPTCNDFWKPRVLSDEEVNELGMLIHDHPYWHMPEIP